MWITVCVSEGSRPVLDSLWTKTLEAVSRHSPRRPSIRGYVRAAWSALEGDHLRGQRTQRLLARLARAALPAGAGDAPPPTCLGGRPRVPWSSTIPGDLRRFTAPTPPGRAAVAGHARGAQSRSTRSTPSSWAPANQFAQAASQAVAELPSRGLQPALHLRRRGTRQDPPAPRRRPPERQALRRDGGVLRLVGALHERADQRHPLRPHRRVPRALPHHRPPAHRRHPVHLRQGADAGGVLPHLQRSLRVAQADRRLQRLLAQGHSGHRGAPALALRVGPDRRHPATGLRDPGGDPQEEGRAGPGAAAPTTSPTSSPVASSPTSASSRARSPG